MNVDRFFYLFLPPGLGVDETIGRLQRHPSLEYVEADGIGSGGTTIPNTVLEVITNVIDHGMNLQEAIDAPRIHHQWLPDEIYDEPIGVSADTRRALEARGHKFRVKRDYLSDAQGIMIEEKTNVRLGASDARQDGAAVGY